MNNLPTTILDRPCARRSDETAGRDERMLRSRSNKRIRNEERCCCSKLVLDIESPIQGEHWSDAFLHRLRGEILLKRDPANTAPAEDALLTAIAIAQQQKAHSFELRAALSLAKLYQSNGRPADAHAVLASALKGFSPTPEFPEIAEAQALLSALA